MPSPDCSTPPDRSGLAFGLLLVVLVAWTYAPVRHFAFVRWDDDINFTQNPLVTDPWSPALAVRLLGAGETLRFRPLHWWCARALHATAGFDPAVWHLFGLALHTAVTVLFFVVLRQVLAMLRPAAAPPWRNLAAGFGAALWAVHPLRAEPVAWATASTYPLATLGVLGSFACYLEAHRRPARWRRWLGGAWLGAVAAYASYPVALAFPLLLVLADLWLLPRGDSAPPWRTVGSRAWWIKHAGFLLPAALALVPTLWSRLSQPGIFVNAPTMDAVGLPLRALMALASLGELVRSLVWPANLTPNVPPLVWTRDALGLVLALAVGAALALTAAWRARRTRPGVTFLVFGFGALALPCLGWTERPTWPVDRYSYLAHLVLWSGVAVGITRFVAGAPWRRWVWPVVGSVAVLLSLSSTRRQLGIWHDSRSLFTHMEQHPGFADNPRQQGHVYVLWANHEATAGRAARAAELFHRAQQTYLDAIRAALARGDPAEALALSTHLERHFTLTPVLHRERAAWLLQLGRPAEARTELAAAAPALGADPRWRALWATAGN